VNNVSDLGQIEERASKDESTDETSADIFTACRAFCKLHNRYTR
jgi:hypothetical protein